MILAIPLRPKRLTHHGQRYQHCKAPKNHRRLINISPHASLRAKKISQIRFQIRGTYLYIYINETRAGQWYVRPLTAWTGLGPDAQFSACVESSGDRAM